MKKILSVIVPAYNAEKYLEDNLQSFCLPDLLEDIEVLVVNDGSSDRTEEIAERYAKRYPQTYRVITKENGGHGSGINCGIAHAAGEYYKVVDADDWVDGGGFRCLVKTLKERGTDVVYAGFRWAYDEGQSRKEDFRTEAEFDKPFDGVEYQRIYQFDDVADRLYMKMHHMTVRTKILRENRIRIDEHCFYVDTEYITFPIPYVKTICFMEEMVYFYRIGREGQSIALAVMQKNESHYDKVLASLTGFYGRLETAAGAGETCTGREGKNEDIICCSAAKRQYIARIVARTVAGRIKVMLSFPPSAGKRRELMAFDRRLKADFPDIYHANVNRAVWLLRLSHYLIYVPLSALVRRRGR